MPPPSEARTNLYKPYTKSKSIYARNQGKYSVKMTFVNGYQKSGNFYTLEDAQACIDDNYDELNEIAQTAPCDQWYDICNEVIFKNQIARDFNVAHK